MSKEDQLGDACENGEFDEAKRLIGEGVDVDSNNADGWTPLENAVRGGHIDIIRLLLDHGANVNKRDIYGWAVLHLAACEGQDEAVRLLIKRGAHLHVKHDAEKTALDDAKEYDQSSTAAIIKAAIKSTKGKNE